MRRRREANGGLGVSFGSLEVSLVGEIVANVGEKVDCFSLGESALNVLEGPKAWRIAVLADIVVKMPGPFSYQI